MGTHNNFRKFLPIVFFLAIFLFSMVSLTSFAQGTAMSIGDISLTPGDTTTVYITLDEAIDGLGRFDGTISSSNPDVLELVSISPEAVSQQFLQVDSEKKDAIKFKLVDLGKKIDPGDKRVQLLSVEVKGVKEGSAELTFEGIKYTDEDGNVIEPKVTPGNITVESAQPEEQKPQETQETKDEKKDTEPEETKTEEKTEKKPEEKQAKTEEKAEEGKEDYLPELEGIKLKLGKSGKVTLSVSSLPKGLRLAQVWIISSGGVTFDRVTVLNPSYSEVVKRSDNLISFRVGDFDGEISPETGNLKLAEVSLKAVKVGKTDLRSRLSVWTDTGERVNSQGEPATVEVTIGSIGSSTKPPKDLNGDGLYEDVNGDGELTQGDPFTLAFNMKSQSIKNSASLFDFNWDGKVTFDDAVELMKKVS